MATILENIKGTQEYIAILKFMVETDYMKIVKSSYAPLRLEKWYGFNSNLQSVKSDRHEVTFSEDIPTVFDRIHRTYYPDSDSMLMAYGKKPESDSSIAPHRDHSFCQAKAIMINFGSSVFTEHPYDSDPIDYTLQPGDIIEIDTKLIHSSKQISDRRYNATFRKVRPEYLPSKASKLF
jgi:hypothetical protein